MATPPAGHISRVNEDAGSGRSDHQRNRRQILAAAAELLRGGEQVTATAVATRAGVGRATVYRHFEGIGPLIAAAREFEAGEAEPGGHGFDLHAALEHVPPQGLVDVIAAEAARRCGDVPVAVYLVDIDGSKLLRAAGSHELPPAIDCACAVGPEVPGVLLPDLEAAVRDGVPGAVSQPLVVRSRAVGVLVVAGDVDRDLLRDLTSDGAVALVLGDRLTDELHRTRRHRDTTAAAETQQVLLPARTARMGGLRFAGDVQPGYENGGNWFDHVENHDGAWIAAIDTLGSGDRAAAISAVLLGALRAARMGGSTPSDALAAMDRSLRGIGIPDAVCSAWVARWHAPTAHLFWAAAGDLVPFSIEDRRRTRLAGVRGEPLGTRSFAAPPTHHERLQPEQLILLVSDGTLGGDGAPLDDRSLDAALRAGPMTPEAATVRVTRAVVDGPGDLGDDAMVLALRRDLEREV